LTIGTRKPTPIQGEAPASAARRTLIVTPTQRKGIAATASTTCIASGTLPSVSFRRITLGTTYPSGDHVFFVNA
jgi:hypothetical protein